MAEPFVHLHAHTIFSMLDGCAKPEDYFAECKNRQWPAMAITEHGILSSIPDSYFASKEHNVKYIVGCEVYYSDYEPKRQEMVSKGLSINDLDKEVVSKFRRNRHLTVLCKNMKGYENLLKINIAAWEDGFYYKPRTWFDLLAKYREGLIILSGCLNGPIANGLIYEGEISPAKYVEMFDEVWGDDFYIELQMPCIQFKVGEDKFIPDKDIFKKLVELADEKHKKTIIETDSHYMKREDFKLQKLMMAIDQGVTVDDPNLFYVDSDEQFFKTREQLRETYTTKGYSEGLGLDVFEKACDNTLEVADKCEWFKPDLSPKLPSIEDADRKLVSLTLKGLKEKGFDKDDTKYVVDGQSVTYREQMEIELRRIIEKGFSSYFLITKDLIDHARVVYGPESVGPSRGSAGGSLVCYLISITRLDPIKWGLSFTRFLSPSRGGNMLNVTMK